MGSNLVLIQVDEGEEFMDLLRDAEECFQAWFDDISVWSSDVVVRERYAWVRCQGVPLHAWKEDFFRVIVMGVGSYVTEDLKTTKMQHLDMARVLIRTTSWEVINSVLKVCVNGLVFSVRIVEEPFSDYMPDIHEGRGNHAKGVGSSSSDSWGSIGVQCRYPIRAGGGIGRRC